VTCLTGLIKKTQQETQEQPKGHKVEQSVWEVFGKCFVRGNPNWFVLSLYLGQKPWSSPATTRQTMGCLQSAKLPSTALSTRITPLFSDKNRFAHMWANVGFPYFDQKRQRYMGFAFLWTLLAFLFTTWGCLAVFNFSFLIKYSAWASGVSYDGALPYIGEDYGAVYIGLRGYYFQDCNATITAAQYCIETGKGCGSSASFLLLDERTFRLRRVLG